MPAIFPFHGLRYGPTAGPLDRVVTPPYDVISPREQTALYRRSPQNFVRVLYGRRRGADRPGRDRYSRAQATFRDWIARGILRRDRQPACYPYRQRFTVQGRPYDRWGVVGLIRLGDPTIFPHEETHSAPKEDRLRLLRVVQANLSPIFGLVEDAGRTFRERLGRQTARPPLASVRFRGVQHDLWRITLPGAIRMLQTLLEPRPLLLADGHHRYEVAMAYREILRRHDRRFGPNHPANFMMMDVAAFDEQDPGILATHRVIGGVPPWTLEGLAAAGAPWLTVERMADGAAMQAALAARPAQALPAIGCYAGAGQWAVVALGVPQPAISLDVELLHRAIVPRLLASTPEAMARATVTYTQAWEAAVSQVARQRGGSAWYLRPLTLAQILGGVKAQRRLPQKSTYFVPKPLAGLVIHRLQLPGVLPRAGGPARGLSRRPLTRGAWRRLPSRRPLAAAEVA